ncbi:MAG: hypothetical protein EZS28_036989 [Streblomastix strix]|uniref:Uncharacterized protein n=1 Tax=Streblomastix strix TaxID=222440 RepID=A0A5J4UBA1_9EUKA|nr:MAG: hypothetical protein EZS28_036989 [Streblomastix strix]
MGDYAYSAENLLVWVYQESWIETDQIVPDQVTPASDNTPSVDSGAGIAGIQTDYARGDHQHPLQDSSILPSKDTTNGEEGVANTYARSDHTHHVNLSSDTPLKDTGTGTAGTSSVYASATHQHQLNVDPSIVNVPLVNATAAANDTSDYYNRNDHVHPQQLNYDGNITATKFIKTGCTSNDILLADGSTKQTAVAGRSFTVIDPEQYVKLYSIIVVNSNTDNFIKFEVSTRTGFGLLQFNQHWTRGQGISEYQYLFIPTLATGINKAFVLYFNDGVDRYGELWCKIDYNSYIRFIYATEVSAFQGNITNILTTDGQTELPDDYSVIQQLFPNSYNQTVQIKPLIHRTFNEGIRISRNLTNLWGNIQCGSDPNSITGFINNQWLIGSIGNNAVNSLVFTIVKVGQESQPDKGLQINADGNILNFYGKMNSGNLQINPTATGYDDGLRISRAEPTSSGNSSIQLGCSRDSNTGAIDGQWSIFTLPSSSTNNPQSFVIAVASQAGDNTSCLQISADLNTLTFNGRVH